MPVLLAVKHHESATACTADFSASSTGIYCGLVGGGFMMFYCPNNTRFAVAEALKAHGGRVQHYHLTTNGLTQWTNK